MPWAKLDDRFDEHRKVHRAGLEATGLYACALSYCARYLTDGHLDSDWLERRVPTQRKREQLLSILVEQGLFEANGDGYKVHDYLEHNPSRADWEHRRELATARKRKERSRDDF